jgi:hypothetical protein
MSMDQKNHERPNRIPVDISVSIVSVLETAEGTLRDLTEYGALIEGFSLPKGTQFQIEYQGQTVYGFVIWAEPDRFGARFPFTLCEGPLYSRLQQARLEHETRQHGRPPFASMVGVSRGLPQFGRRGLS